MKTIFISRTAVAAVFTLSSCLPMPQLPGEEITLVIRNVNVNVGFTEEYMDEEPEVIPIDINDNGTADFAFVSAQMTESEGIGVIAAIMSLAEGNSTIVLDTDPLVVCEAKVPFAPARALGINMIIDGNSIWYENGLLYGHYLSDSGCFDYVRNVDYNIPQYIAIQFSEGGEAYFGYLRMVAHDTSNDGMEGCPEMWTIDQIVYSSFPNTALRTPA